MITAILDLLGLRRLRYPGNTTRELEALRKIKQAEDDDLSERGYSIFCHCRSDVLGTIREIDRDLLIRKRRGIDGIHRPVPKFDTAILKEDQ